MLPKRLELRNFLAYRAPDPLNLEDLHLACLSGMNGAGKSSLLDAITWALWGKARAGSDELVHIGESEMWVALDFVQGQQLFRVIRKRKLGGVRQSGGRALGQSELNLFAWDTHKEVFALISEPSMQETQSKINHLLHLDHELFVNSAFLQQGQADAFTQKKTPAERKKLLYDILGLERWERYEEKTKLTLQDIARESDLIQQRLTEIEQEIREEPALKGELEVARQQLGDSEAEVAGAEARLEEVKGADIELRAAEEALMTTQFSIAERQKDISALAEEITRYEGSLADYQAVIAEQEQIQAGYAQLEAARAADLELGDKLRQLNDLNQRLAQLEKQLSQAQQNLELEARELETAIVKDEEIAEAAEWVTAALAQLDGEIGGLEALEAERESTQEQIGTLEIDIAALKATNEGIHREAENIKERITILEKSTEALCPVCQQPLNEVQKQNLLAEMNTDVEERREAYRQHKAEQRNLEDSIKTMRGMLTSASQSLKDLPRLRHQRGGYEQQLKEAQTAAQRIHASEIKLQEVQKALLEGRFGAEIRAQLAEAQAEHATLGYDASAHNAVRETLETHLSYQTKAQALEVARQALPNLEKSLENAQQRQLRWQKNLAEYEAQAATHQADIERLQVKVGVMHTRLNELNEKRSHQRQAQEKVTTIEQKLRAIESLRKRQTELTERRDDLRLEEGVYDQLKMAFGRNGIPAMIIETAIPELEEAANRLLSRMTNNRMHIQLITQKDKKSGGVAETLDILVADELGTRPYGLFSGGEAFRVDFAVRVALSQLLARRAGAQLRTLFIDEGFGTQDDVGRERLIEAITSIQEDFDLILVITHIEELKEAFPARIDVTKTPNGSLAVIR